MTEELLLYTLAGFVAQLIDGTLSMGYGVSATTLLLSMGVAPAGASASVHTAEVVATAFSAYNHWRQKNVIAAFVKKLMIPGVIGAVIGAYILTSVPGETIRPFMASYLVVMGIVILVKAFRPLPQTESHAHIVPLGLAGGFFDSIGGGGWGPIVAGTLIARGNAPRTTIGSVAFAEFFVTVAASATLLLTVGVSSWLPIAGLALGGALASPIAARMTGRIPARPLMIAVGLLVILLSLRTLWSAAAKAAAL
jgi:uncharacterized membrane protein YfcA